MGVLDTLRAKWRALLYRQMIREMWGEAPVGLVLWLACIVAGVALALAFIFAIGGVIDRLPAAVSGGTGSSAARDVEVALAIAAVLLVAQPVVASLKSLVASRLGRKVEGAIRARVMRAVLSRPTIEHLHDAEVVNEIAAATTLGTAQYGVLNAVMSMGPLLESLLTGLAMCAVVVVFEWWVGILLAAGWFWARAARFSENVRQFSASSSGSPVTRRQVYFRELAMTAAGAKEIRVFGLAGWLADRLHIGWLTAMRAVWADRRTRYSSATVTLLVLLVANSIAFVVIIRAGVDGEIGLGEVTVLIQAVLGARLLADLGASTVFDVNFVQGAAPLSGVARLEAALASAASASSGADALDQNATAPVVGAREAVRFERVSFRYPHHDRAVLDGLDLTLDAGTSLAIVGVNGAGKTTLVRLLAGLMRPAAGTITVDGRDLLELDLEEWRSHMAVVFQDFARFPITLRENVGFGALDIVLDEGTFDEIVDRAGLTSVVDALPNAHDTPLSAQMHGGSDLSGGEWQRVALARALAAVHAGASILVLDEPTANLDVRAEAAFYDRFLELTEGLTTVVISHRFATVRRADAIAVLDGGRITELGSHDELMRLDGTYAHLFRLQASAFDEPEPERDPERMR